jgi:hypothetical protein
MMQSFLTRFWLEGVNLSIYISNRSLTFYVGDKTLNETYSRRRSMIDHLIIFRCIAYAHISDKKRKLYFSWY